MFLLDGFWWMGFLNSCSYKDDFIDGKKYWFLLGVGLEVRLIYFKIVLIFMNFDCKGWGKEVDLLFVYLWMYVCVYVF